MAILSYANDVFSRGTVAIDDRRLYDIILEAAEKRLGKRLRRINRGFLKLILKRLAMSTVIKGGKILKVRIFIFNIETGPEETTVKLWLSLPLPDDTVGKNSAVWNLIQNKLRIPDASINEMGELCMSLKISNIDCPIKDGDIRNGKRYFFIQKSKSFEELIADWDYIREEVKK